MDQEKKKLLKQIQGEIIERYRKADVPMVFKTLDCSDDLNTGKFLKLKFIPSDMGTDIVTLWSE